MDVPNICKFLYVASDRKYGDFLIEQWLRSLRHNVNLERCEVRFLDYGLSTAQRFYLQNHDVRLVQAERNGHPAVIRFRAVSEAIRSRFHVFLTDYFFSSDDQKRLRKVLSENSQINAGFLLAPSALLVDLCNAVTTTVLHHDKFGPDKLVVNAFLHARGWVELDRGFHFVVATADRPLEIQDGIFLFAETKTPIPVIHNAGNISALRPVDGFGYGPGHNRLKKDVLQSLRLIHRSNEFVLDTQLSVDKWRSQVRRKLVAQAKKLRALSQGSSQ